MMFSTIPIGIEDLSLNTKALSSPRRRGSNSAIRDGLTFLWIPAFAGMTPVKSVTIN